MEVHVREQCSAASGDEKQGRKRGNVAKKIYQKNPTHIHRNGLFFLLFQGFIAAGLAGDCELLRGVPGRLRMLVHGGFTHYPGPAASWGANQDDQHEPQPAQASMIFTSSRLMYSSTVHQSLSHIDPPLNEPSLLCTMSNN